MFERWTPRTHESRELVCQSEAKREQVPQSEANVCRHKCNLKKPRLLIAQQKLGAIRQLFYGRNSRFCEQFLVASQSKHGNEI